MGKIVGYVRVSSKDQNADRQMDEMEKRGVLRKHIYLDQKSGCNFERPSYRKMIREIRKGDLILIKSIDRLGRNYREVIEQWQLLTRDKGVDVRVLDMPLLDTTIAKDLLGTFISDLVLQLLSFVAENERAMIRARQAEGIEAARRRGVKFGRPRREKPPWFDAVFPPMAARRDYTEKGSGTLGSARIHLCDDGQTRNGTKCRLNLSI